MATTDITLESSGNTVKFQNVFKVGTSQSGIVITTPQKMYLPVETSHNTESGPIFTMTNCVLKLPGGTNEY